MQQCHLRICGCAIAMCSGCSMMRKAAFTPPSTTVLLCGRLQAQGDVCGVTSCYRMKAECRAVFLACSWSS